MEGKFITKPLVERLVDAKIRGHITDAEFAKQIKAGHKPNSKITVMVVVMEE
jgi:hypothetical protein